MNNGLKELFSIQEVLKDAGYYDISRIAKEVLEYSQNKHIPLVRIFAEITEGKPWEYIKGSGEFRGLNFLLNSSTLIPRIETEQIVDIAVAELAKNSYKNIVDVGTGSGCIIISLVKELENSKYHYFATDISRRALNVAQISEKNLLDGKYIVWENTNLISDLTLTGATLIIANLPYIPTSQYLKLDRSVLDFEPRQALDGGNTGIKYYKDLLQQMRNKSVQGTVILEIEPSTLSLFQEYNPVVIKDLYNQDRFLLISLH